MPQNSPIPHDSWAEAYDVAYEQSFGDFYESLTTTTLGLVLGTILPPVRIVDFGAGTGRLSIPLAGHGFQMDAVDPSVGMLDQLRAKDPKGAVAVHRMRM
ncbi:MAG TPA: class I SAM-dependent methyltransferase [Planctomycetaceae bacterium]|nr:class I SAM-dependent methyltransferase [Planctomycetaceae bacterium]